MTKNVTFGDLRGGDQFIYQCAADLAKGQEDTEPMGGVLVYIKLETPIVPDGLANTMETPFTAITKRSGGFTAIPDDTEVILLEK